MMGSLWFETNSLWHLSQVTFITSSNTERTTCTSTSCESRCHRTPPDETRFSSNNRNSTLHTSYIVSKNWTGWRSACSPTPHPYEGDYSPLSLERTFIVSSIPRGWPPAQSARSEVFELSDSFSLYGCA